MSEQKKPDATVAAQTKRSDPEPRRHDGAFDVILVNSDPRRKYVFAYLGDSQLGADFYEHLGYKREVLQEGGVRISGVKSVKPGDLLTFRGHVLMSIELEEAQKLYQNGGAGAGLGQREWDQREKKIGMNPLGNMSGSRYMISQTKTENRTEVGRL